MTKEVSNVNDKILFRCLCGYQEEGNVEDTLMYQEYLESADSNQKHEDFIAQAAFDPAGMIVAKQCPGCPLDYLTMIRLGASEMVIYTCANCGYRASHDDYEKVIK